ncbi:MAG: tRNA (guanosine(46)-N7)-methyltransferase TrmB [Oscillospiraceae bacterium]|nr:tRNA (guanosine(46)-N7)-methyltransferase TrmB [Oscillospiraceae bacterium]MCI1990953.1 tRNA (guanosine(46)-N7)-methyltransferase TrmB [Oscillospiraceae bacterium]MCI2035041.1 tRNA (guanosine(46)-N7)-methyltransferase TrmB [Oscillospiraceae bacterium]
MRMRNKPWAGPELDACPFFIRSPEQYLGKWHSLFPRRQPVDLELGCGKGFFLAGAAPADPATNFIGIDIKDAVLGPAKRNIEKAFREAGREPDNVILTVLNIERILEDMGPEDSVRRIDINFCNPWPKPRHHKRRLTHPRQLEKYKAILEPNGEIFFKTDDDGLFRDTLGYLAECGYTVTDRTDDLRGAGWPDDIPTEHEMMFLQKGIPIKALRAVWPG